MRKIFLSLVALFVMAITAQATIVNGVNYYFNGANAWVYQNYDYTFYQGDVVVPEKVTYNETEYTVTKVSTSAFYNQTGMTSISLPNTITEIGDYAFKGCTGLSTFEMPNSVTSLGDYVFQESGIESITLSTNASCEYLRDGMFKNCTSLTSINIPGNYRYINSYCFEGCTALETVTLNEGLVYIKQRAFKDCSSLTSLTIPESVESIEWNYPMFDNCTSLTAFTVAAGNPYYSSQDGVLYNKYKKDLYFYPGGKVGAFTIPDGVTYVSSNAFNGCVGLTSLTVPASVTSMSAVSTKSGLTEIIVDGGNTKYTAVDGVLYTKDMTKLLCYPSAKPGSTYTIPATVTSISNTAFNNTALYADPANWENGVMYVDNCIVSVNTGSVPANLVLKSGTRLIPDQSFQFCSALTSIDIPASMRGIGSSAFLACSQLTDITIRSGIQYMGQNPFESTGYFKEASNWDEFGALYVGEYLVKVHDTVTTDAFVVKEGTSLIASYAFPVNDKITGTMTLPASIKYINQENFSYAKFTTLKIQTSTPPVLQLSASHPLMPYTNKAGIKLQAPCIDAYTSADIWSAFTDNESIGYDGILSVSSNDEDMGTVAITKDPACADETAELTATPKPGYKFVRWDNGALTSVLSLSNLDKQTWQAEFALKPTPKVGDVFTQTIGGVEYTFKVTSVGTGVNFVQLGNGTDPCISTATEGAITLPTNAEYLEVDFSVNALANSCFANCAELTSVTIPSGQGITSVPYCAFMSCSKLASLVIPEGVTSLEQYGLQESGIETLTIPASVTSISDEFLRNCQSLQSITVTDGNTTYTSENGVLFNATMTQVIKYPSAKAATSYAIPEGVTILASNSFDYTANLASVTFPTTLAAIGNTAFYHSAIEAVLLPETGGAFTISPRAFDQCTALQTVYLPKTLAPLEYQVFHLCTALESVTIWAETPIARATVPNKEYFKQCNDDAILYVPIDSKSAYAAADEWNHFDAEHIKGLCVVTFLDDEDNVLKLDTVVEGHAASAPDLAPRVGYEASWDNAFNAVTSNLTVKAQYAEIISSIEATLVFPQAGQEAGANTLLDWTGNKLTGGYTVLASDGSTNVNAEILAPSTDYYVQVTFDAKSGYVFANDVAITVNGAAVADKLIATANQQTIRLPFTTTATGVDEIVNGQSSNRKFIKDGQLFIERDGKTFNAQGVEVK